MKKDYRKIALFPAGTSHGCPPVEPDPVFDALAKAAAHSLGTPAVSILIEPSARNARIHVGHGFDQHSQMPGRRICGEAMDLKRLVTGRATAGDPSPFSYCAAAPIVCDSGEVLGSLCLRDSKPIELTGVRQSAFRAVTQSIVASVEATREAKAAKQQATRIERQLRMSRAVQAMTDVAVSAPDCSTALQRTLDSLCTHLGWPGATAWRIDERGWLTHSAASFASASLSSAAAELLGTADRPPQILQLLAESARMKRTRCEGGVAAVPVLGQTSPVVLELWISQEDREEEALEGMLDSFAQQYAIIASRAEAMAHLRESEEECRDLFDHSLDCICVHDIEGRLLKVNSSMAESLGHDDPSELIGRSVRSLLVPSVAAGFDRYVDTIIADGIAEGNMRVQTQTGEERVFHYRNTMRLDRGKAVVLSIARDVTEAIATRTRLRQAEREKTLGLLRTTLEERESEDRAHRERLSSIVREWTTIFDAMPLPMLVVDENLTIDRRNRAANALLGHPPDATLTLRSYADREPWSTVAEMCRSNRNMSQEVTSRETDHVWDIAVSRHDSQERGRRQSIVVVRDVTLSHDLQRSVRQFEAMSELGTLVVAVAHEVRNPLAGIGASLDALEACLGTAPAQAKFMARLRRELGRLNSVMSDLLEYGHVRPLLLRVARMEDLISAAVSACQSLAALRGVELQVAPCPSSLPIRVDSNRVLQVLQNVIENAIQHSPMGGKVSIRAREKSRATGVWTIVTIEDHGPGFDPGSLHRVFEPFFTRRPGGTGLGLSLVQKLVREHGGTVAARNATNGGAVLEISLRSHRDPTG